MYAVSSILSTVVVWRYFRGNHKRKQSMMNAKEVNGIP